MTETLHDTALQARKSIGLLTEDEVAAMLDINTSTLATWRSQKTGPGHIKLGKGGFYRLADINDWTMRCAVETKEAA